MAEDDKYTYPVSGAVLVNRFGIRDASRLEHATIEHASVAMADIYAEASPD